MSLSVTIVTARAFPHTGGIETHVDEVSRRLVAGGVRVTVLTTFAGSDLPRVEDRAGVVMRRYPAYLGDAYFSLPLARAIAASAPDVMHLQGVHTLVAPMAMMAAERARLPVVLTFHTGGHSSRVRSMLRGAQWRALAPLLRRADALVAVSRSEVELFSRALRLPPARFRFVPNGAELPSPAAWGGGEALRGANHEPLVVSVGRLERYKGHHRVVAAMPAVLAAAPTARLVVAGAGPYEQRLRRLAASLGVSHAVHIESFGPERRGDLASLISRADVVTLMSEYEANPVAVLEALALGRPVVAAATSGLVELGGEGGVRLVDLRASPAALAAELLEAARTPRPTSGLTPGRPHVRGWDACADDLLALYTEVTTCAS